MVNFFVWKSPSSVNIVDILALRGVSELMWCWRGTASVAAWDLLHSGLWSPNSWSSQDAASESSASASKSWRRLWFRILGSDCQDQMVGHPWSAQARTKHNKSCQNRFCANLALLVLWNRYLTLLAKNLSHTSPSGFCSSNWCRRGCNYFATGSLAAPRPKPYVLFPIFVPCQIKILLVCTCPCPCIFFLCYNLLY